MSGRHALERAPADVEELEDRLSEPTPALVASMAELEGDIVVLGAAGKMGPSLCRMAKRASEAAGIERRVVAVSRFSSPGSLDAFKAHGIETVASDLLDPDAVARLPDAPNVVFMAGMKFGATGQEAATWAVNTYLPGVVAHRFRTSRIVAFSTGNVYPLTPVSQGGSVETDTPEPIGEYAMSCLGRERILEHASQAAGTPVVLLRLNYAVELRYGVLLDIAERVRDGLPVDLTQGAVNVIWQAEANEMALRAFAHSSTPATVLNVSGPEILSVRRLATQFADLLGTTAVLSGVEQPTALLSNGELGYRLFGYPRVPVPRLVEWTADWIGRGAPTLGKPTRFDVRDGRF